MMTTLGIIIAMVSVVAGECVAKRAHLKDIIEDHGGIIPAIGSLLLSFVVAVIVAGLLIGSLPVPKFIMYLLWPLAVFGVAVVVSWVRFGIEPLGNSDGEHGVTMRGATLDNEKEAAAINKRSRKADEETMFFAGIPVEPETEQKHFKLIGGTGTGKSTVIREMIDRARQRGDRLIITDPDGGYLANFYDPERDKILNPYDARSAMWDMFAEIKNPYDARLLADSIIPAGRAGDEWPGYARTFVAALLGQCKRKGMTIADFWNLAMCAPQEVLHEFLAGTPAAPYTEPNNARMLGSIRSVAGTSLAALEYVKDAQGRPMNIRDWIRNGTGMLFIPYQASQIASMGQLVSAWMRLGIVELMEMPEQDNRVWFCIDELDAIGRIDGLKDAIARLRKYGGRIVVGFQSISQVYAIYGEEEAATILENCTNTLILRCSASQDGGTSAFASQLIGEREKLQNGNMVLSKLILPSEIERMPDLQGYVKVSEYPSWFSITLEPYPLPRVAERFELRAFA